MELSDTLIDHTDERIQKDVLIHMVPQAEAGVSILINHDIDQIVGHSYKASLEPIPNDPDNFVMVVYFYISPLKMAKNGGTIIDDIADGLLKFASISFRNRKVCLLCS